LSYATDGVVMADPSGAMQAMSTVVAPLEQTGHETSGELPVVVQQPAPSGDSGGETTSAADAAGSGPGEVEVGDASSGSKSSVQAKGMALAAIVAFVGLVV